MTLGSLSLSDLTRRPWSQPPGGRPASGGALGSRAKVPSGHQGAEAPRRGTRLPLRRADWTLPDKPAEGLRTAPLQPGWPSGLCCSLFCKVC